MQTASVPLVAVAAEVLTEAQAPSPAHAQPSWREQDMASMRHYIQQGWKSLRRSVMDCTALADPKVSEKPVMYFPVEMEVPAEIKALEAECRITVEHLPKRISRLGELDPTTLATHGLLYLPNPYVVPGGMFNEMYGWDSYFIIRGLIRDGEIELATGMVENFFFEIEHYGAILNANRTYYLTRSQPPFLTSMIMAVHEANVARGTNDLKWLERGYEFAVRDHQLWTSAPHLAQETGLSRYYDLGGGPVPEMAEDPHYFADVAAWLLRHEGKGEYVAFADDNIATAGPAFHMQVCGDTKPNATQPCSRTHELKLTADYYKGDRAMRESGFDVSFRFGAFSGSTHHYAPVCLNSLLYKAEKDMEQMALVLGKAEEAATWRERAAIRKAAVDTYLWNEQRGMYFDYDFVNAKQSNYEYATTFYPLWAGLASEKQAAALLKNLERFEQAGGMVMSGGHNDSGTQWDFPYGWAPIQLLATEGMRQYGFVNAADRLSAKFVDTVLENFLKDHTIREKYNVVGRTSETHITAGYKANVVGFGWTNGTVLELLHAVQAPKAKAAAATR